MSYKKRSKSIKSIINTLSIVSTLFSTFCNLTRLIRLEARIAGKSLIVLFIFLAMSAILLTSSWICLLAIGYLKLISLQWSAINALLLLLGFNFFLLIILGLSISKVKKNLLFPATCEQCLNIYYRMNREGD